MEVLKAFQMMMGSLKGHCEMWHFRHSLGSESLFTEYPEKPAFLGIAYIGKP